MLTLARAVDARAKPREEQQGAGLGEEEEDDDAAPSQDAILKHGHAQSSAVEMIAVPADPACGLWTCGDDKTARRWRGDGTVDPTSTLRHRTSVWCVLPLPDGRVVTGSGMNNAMEVLQVWAPERDDPANPGGFSRETQLSGHTNAVLDLALLPDGRCPHALSRPGIALEPPLNWP